MLDLETQFIKYQRKIFAEMQLQYKSSSKEQIQMYENFCGSSIVKKKTYQEFCDSSDEYILEENLKWYIFGKSCVDKVLKTNLSLPNFLKWFRRFSHTNAGLAYVECMTKELINAKVRGGYYEKLEDVIAYINTSCLDYVREDEKEYVKNNLEEWRNNKDILKVFDDRDRARMSVYYISDGSLYDVLTPLLNIDNKKIISILSKVECIMQVEEFLSTNAVELDIDTICDFLKLAPAITKDGKNWNNKQVLVPLLTIALNRYLNKVYQSLVNASGTKEATEKELKLRIDKFMNVLLTRKDCEFISRKWILHLMSVIERGSDAQKEITRLIASSLASKITFKYSDFLTAFLEQELENNNDKILLLALIYATKSVQFPESYINIFEKYILDLNESLFVYPDNRSSYFNMEHYILSQLYIEMVDSAEKWGKLWQRLYKERRLAMFSRHGGIHYEIYHSKYLILIGIAATEYFVSDKNKNSALKMISKIWSALMELYLVMPSFLHDDFLKSMISRLIVFKSFIGESIEQEINMIRNNPAMISIVILNLKKNNINIEFISKYPELLDNMKYYIDIENAKKQKYGKNNNKNFFQELEAIYFEHYK